MSKKNEITEEELQQEELEQQEQEKQEAQEEQAEEGSKLEAELEEAQQQIEDLKDKNLRMMAEFENFRKRTAKEKLELQATAGERIFKDMLALVDDFERAEKAMADSEDVKAVREGIDLIHKKFIAFLADHDVKAIETEDADFDVDKHEAITTLAAGEDKKGKIIDCTQKGYTLGDKVIRYSKVVVGA
ncbi:MAG: nucleotide exchange factor GrpE [Paludibacteraceae bacterium]|nr:nucleotide exchange factor GrpE [Paludibacteraceae bacterium]